MLALELKKKGRKERGGTPTSMRAFRHWKRSPTAFPHEIGGGKRKGGKKGKEKLRENVCLVTVIISGRPLDPGKKERKIHP